MDVYPEAKIILTVRDPAAWARSVRATVWETRHGDSLLRHLSAARAQVDPKWNAYDELMFDLMWRERAPLHEGAADPDRLPELMQRFNEQVQADVPADRLLVW